MPQACENCPFSQAEAGLRLRESLEPRRWVGILKGVLAGRHFLCHKTTTETGNGTNLICAGAIETAAAHGVKADVVQAMERLEQYAAEERGQHVHKREAQRLRRLEYLRETGRTETPRKTTNERK